MEGDGPHARVGVLHQQGFAKRIAVARKQGVRHLLHAGVNRLDDGDVGEQLVPLTHQPFAQHIGGQGASEQQRQQQAQQQAQRQANPASSGSGAGGSTSSGGQSFGSGGASTAGLGITLNINLSGDPNANAQEIMAQIGPVLLQQLVQQLATLKRSS